MWTMTFFPLLLLLSLSSICRAAERQEDHLAIRQTNSATGDSQCSDTMCVSATVNGSDVEYVLKSTGKQSLGWMAMGFGTGMTNSPMVVMWSNSNGNITLSQRSAQGHVLPTVDPNPPRIASLSTDLSSTSGNQPKFAFTIPADSSTKQSIIWAFGVDPPASSAEDATFSLHYDSGALTLDLTKTLPSSSDPNSTNDSGSSTTPSTYTSYQRSVIAHAVCCAVGFLVILPGGALLARYLRTIWPLWFKAHFLVQFFIAGPILITGIALAHAAVQNSSNGHVNDNHKKWGVALYILYVAQLVLGAGIHWIKPKNVTGRPPQNYLHGLLGLVIIGLAFYEVRLGYNVEWPSFVGRGPAPKAVGVVWYVWVVLLPILYAIGLALLPRQYRQERKNRAPSNNFDMDNVRFKAYETGA